MYMYQLSQNYKVLQNVPVYQFHVSRENALGSYAFVPQKGMHCASTMDQSIVHKMEGVTANGH